MRTYLLALTKYGLAASVLAYTVLAFLLLREKKKYNITLMTVLESVFIMVYQFLAFLTLSVAKEDFKYIFFFLVLAVMFFAAMTLFRSLYKNAHMALFNNMCMLLSIGLVFQGRLSFDNAVHQFVIALLGLLIAVLMPLVRNYFYLLKEPRYVYGLVGIAMLSVVMLLGSTTLGANITWTIAGVTFQPSEFVKILYLFFLAATLREIHTMQDLLIVGIFAAAHVLVLVGSKDLGSGLIFFIIFLFMMYMATNQWIFLAAGFGAGGVGAVIMYFIFDHIQVRVAAFLNPWDYIDSIGYQITQSLFAIGAGGAFGSGLGQGTPEKIPFVSSDFVFAGVCEEMGLIIGVCIVLLCLNCFLHMIILAGGFADRFYRLLSYGIAIEYAFQTFLTLGGETKFIPLTGVTLPLISYGGSSILTTLIMFTLVEMMYMLREDKIDEIRQQHQDFARRSEERIRRRTQSRERYDSYVPRQRGTASYSRQTVGYDTGYLHSDRNYYRDSSYDYDSYDSYSSLDDERDERRYDDM